MPNVDVGFSVILSIVRVEKVLIIIMTYLTFARACEDLNMFIIIIIIRLKMPALNLKKELYDELIRRGIDPTKFMNELVEKKLREIKENA